MGATPRILALAEKSQGLHEGEAEAVEVAVAVFWTGKGGREKGEAEGVEVGEAGDAMGQGALGGVGIRLRGILGMGRRSSSWSWEVCLGLRN